MKLNNFFHFEEIDSTNTKAKKLIKSENLPFVVSADRQTAGRGRLGNVWVSDFNSINISFTFSKSLCEIHFYPYITALCIHSFLTELNLSNVEIKWPNDILIASKKISGTLIEIVGDAIIIGVGINVNQSTDYFNTLKLNGTSLLIEKNGKLDVTKLRTEFVQSFERIFSFYLFNKHSIFKDWESKCPHIGNTIRCRVGKTVEVGVFESLGKSGELLLHNSKGLLKIHAGEIIE